jgi:hypothetical protein
MGTSDESGIDLDSIQAAATSETFFRSAYVLAGFSLSTTIVPVIIGWILQ